MAILKNCPEALRKLALFCLWKYEKYPGDKKPRKVPYNPKTLQRGDSSDPDTFTSWEEINKIWAKHRNEFDGIGIGIFGNICGIDIDDCVNDNKELSELARDIVHRFGCYVEFSPSERGIRGFCIIEQPQDFREWYNSRNFYKKNPKNGVEIYIPGTTKRFLTFTGNVYMKAPVADRSEALRGILEKYMQRDAAAPGASQAGARGLTRELLLEIWDKKPAEELSDQKVFDVLSNNEKFCRLMSGDASDYIGENGEIDDSAADMALCNLLAFGSRRNAEQIDRIFRQSGLYVREDGSIKWDERRPPDSTYGRNTIARAILDCKTVYDPNYGKNPASVDFMGAGLRPSDFTDLGQAKVFASEYGDRVRYTTATSWLVNEDGKVYRESELAAQGLSQELTDRQLKEANKNYLTAQKRLLSAQDNENEEEIEAAKKAIKSLEQYRKFILGRRKSTAIMNTLQQARPMVQVDVEQLDADGYLLNTPGGVVDLRTGKMRPHNPEDYLTKITSVSPSEQGRDMFDSFIEQITCGDPELPRYLQEVAGMCAVGKVFSEKLIIAYGGGGNGKSTFFNLLADVLGDYAGTIPSEALIVRSGNAKDYSVANLRSKRLIIAAELREGARLSTDAVKKMCSTDKVSAEKKYRDPFEFKPSHNIILYTNILPKVGTNDSGTWDRLVVIPFKARFRDAVGEVKNYEEHLLQKCGGAVLEWIIEGAGRFLANGGDIALPECVKAEIDQYREQNDWFGDFIAECCNTGKGLSVGAAELYRAYRNYCDTTGEYKRSRADFSTELINAGYERKQVKGRYRYKGIAIRYADYYPEYGALNIPG